MTATLKEFKARKRRAEIAARMPAPSDVLVIDTETTGLCPWHGDRPFMIIWKLLKGGRWLGQSIDYHVWGVSPQNRAVATKPHELPEPFRRALANPHVLKVFHNAPYDYQMLRMSGLTIAGPVEDTITLARMAWGESDCRLKPLAEKRLQIPFEDEKRLRSRIAHLRSVGKAQGSVERGELVDADYWLPFALDDAEGKAACIEYATTDVLRTAGIWRQATNQLGENNPWAVKERRVFEVCRAMSERGVRISRQRLGRARNNLQEQAEKSLQNLRHLAGDKGFNPRSGPQLAEFLYGRCGFKAVKWTPSGQPSTDAEALALVEGGDPAVLESVVDHKTLTKSLTDLNQYEEAMVSEDAHHGIIHPELRQFGAVTGRFSCASPNLQNVGKRGGSALRHPFGPRPGHVWLLVDYSQIEARLFAVASGDRHMQSIIREGGDIFQVLTERIYAQRAGEWGALRDTVKRAVYAKLYGAGADRIGGVLGISRSEARHIFEGFNSLFPRSEAYAHEVAAKVERDGWVETLGGRRIVADKPHAGVNYVIQGSAADVMKDALLNCAELCQTPKVQMLLTIHDEVVFEVHHSSNLKRVAAVLMDAVSAPGRALGIDLPCAAKVARQAWDQKTSLRV